MREPCTEAQLCTTCFSVVRPTRENLCPACRCRDSLVPTQCLIAKKLHDCKIINGNRILGPRLRATLYEMAASRVLERMERQGMMEADDIPKLHEHRLVGLHTENNLIYSDFGQSSASAGITTAAVAGLMSMAPIVDTSAAASSMTEMVEEPAEEEADYGEYKSPNSRPDAARASAASTLGGGREIKQRGCGAGQVAWAR